MYYVWYQVEGFDGDHSQGPYTRDEYQSHLDDIKGYEGVYNVRLRVSECERRAHE